MMRLLCMLLPLMALVCVTIGSVDGASVASAAATKVAATSGKRTQPDQCEARQKALLKSMKAKFQARLQAQSLILQLNQYRQSLLQTRINYTRNLRRLRRWQMNRIKQRIRRLRRSEGRLRVAYINRMRTLRRRYQRKVIRVITQHGYSRKAIRKLMRFLTGRPRHRMEIYGQLEHPRLYQSIRQRNRMRLVSAQNPMLLSNRRRSVSSVIHLLKHLKPEHKAVERAIKRYLIFRMRIGRIRKLQESLRQRVERFESRRRELKRRISSESSRQRLLQKRKRMPPRAKNSKKSGAPASRRRLDKSTASSRNRVVSLQRREERLAKRIMRTKKRLERLHKRMSLLKRRQARQINTTSMQLRRVSRLIARWRIYGPKRLVKSVKNAQNERKTVRKPTKQTRRPVRKQSLNLRQMNAPKSRREVKRIVNVFVKMHTLFRHVSKELKLTVRNIKRLKQKLSRNKHNPKGAERRRALSVKRRKLESKLASARKKARRLALINQNLILEYPKEFNKYQLSGFIQSEQDALKMINKMLKRVRKRDLRKKLRLSKKLLSPGKGGEGARKALTKSLERRVFRRVRRLQRRIQYESRNVLVVKRRKRHIVRRVNRLSRRERRIEKRRRRIGRRIGRILRKSKRLSRQVKTLNRKSEHSKVGKATVKTPNSKVANRIESKINRKMGRIAALRVRVTHLKQRRLGMKRRIRQIVKKQRRLRRRIRRVNARFRRQVKRARKSVIQKRRFVRHVVSMRLVGKQAVHRLLQRSHRLSAAKRISGNSLVQLPEAKQFPEF